MKNKNKNIPLKTKKLSAGAGADNFLAYWAYDVRWTMNASPQKTATASPAVNAEIAADAGRGATPKRK